MKHLGSGEGYKSYSDIDPTLLETVERAKARKEIGFDPYKFPFYGQDVWNCYEFSCLNIDGTPIVGVLKIMYSCHTAEIIESKSLKLYLNSFNNVRFHPQVSITKTIQRDLEEKISDMMVEVKLFTDERQAIITRPIIGVFQNLREVNSSHVTHGQYYTNLLRSNCRVTNQPDWADCYIAIKGLELLNPNLILDFILSIRNQNHFHEEACELVYSFLQQQYTPAELFVGCLYTRRGGIDINPIRASHPNILYRYATPILNPGYLSIKSIRH